MSKIKAGIIGGAGYTGGELIRLLLNHPSVEIGFIHSKSYSGKKVYEVHRDLYQETDLNFVEQIDLNVDVIFLCVAHGEATDFLKKHQLNGAIKIIDLSQDFRIKGDHQFVYLGMRVVFKARCLVMINPSSVGSYRISKNANSFSSFLFCGTVRM